MSTASHVHARRAEGAQHAPGPLLHTPTLRRTARPSLAVIGAGRAGSALALASHAAGYRVTAVSSRTPASIRRLAAQVGARPVPTAVAAAQAADVTLICVPDAALVRVAATIAATGMALRGRLLLHCSGAHPAAVLSAARITGAQVAALHPLQALTPGAGAEELRGVHFAVDAPAAVRPLLDGLVRDLGGIPFTAPPAAHRAAYHAAAVLAGNAPVALLARATALLEAAGVDPATGAAALATLLEGVARNVRRLGLAAALTGPVARDDAATVEAHLAALRSDPAAQHLYRHLAEETLRVTGPAGHQQVAALLGHAEPALHVTAA